MSKLLLRVEEAAELLGLSRAKLYMMIGAGEVPVVRVGKCVRIPADRLREWVTLNTVEPEKTEIVFGR